jgi:choline dehydrogenase
VGAEVQRVLFSGIEKDLKATGVLIESKGKVYTVEATREIILCGGAIVTPQLLLLRYI